MISIIMGYRDRVFQFKQTLDSYVHFYHDIMDEIQLVVVDDTSTNSQCLDLLQLYNIPFHYKAIDRRDKEFRNPVTAYNLAASMAKYEYLNITNPENMHLSPVLHHARGWLAENRYLVYGCKYSIRGRVEFNDVLLNNDLSIGPDSLGWHQHTEHNNRLLHFSTIISKSDFFRIGGFDERYVDGVGFDDNDFAESVVSSGMEVLAFDDPCVLHQEHDRSYVHNNYAVGFNRNEDLYFQKWAKKAPVHRPGVGVR